MTEVGVNASPSTAEEAIERLIFDPSARANPYPIYERLRAEGPVFRSEALGVSVVAYSTCAEALRHPRLVRRHGDSRERFAILNNAVGRAWYAQQEDFLLFLDPPQHTRIRKLATRAFTPRYVERMREVVTRRTNQLLDDFVASEGGDLIADFALPLPMAIICDILGVPIEDREDFRRWTSALVATLEPLPPKHVQDEADEAAAAFVDYFTHLVRHRREHLSEDLLSRLIAAQEGEQRLTEKELVATAILLLAAGFETTTNLIGNGTFALLSNPRQWQCLVEDPALSSQAVEELLRYESPVQFGTPRIAAEPIELQGVPIREGDIVLTILGAANRDPERFESPNELNITRQHPDPLSFGGGPHFCLGAALARLEGTVAFGRLASRTPGLSLVDPDPKWRPTLNVRGLDRLDVTVG